MRQIKTKEDEVNVEIEFVGNKNIYDLLNQFAEEIIEKINK